MDWLNVNKLFCPFVRVCVLVVCSVLSQECTFVWRTVDEEKDNFFLQFLFHHLVKLPLVDKLGKSEDGIIHFQVTHLRCAEEFALKCTKIFYFPTKFYTSERANKVQIKKIYRELIYNKEV